MKKLLSVLSVVSLSAVMFISCSTNTTTPGTNNNNNNTNNTAANTMTVTVDGTAYTMTSVGAKGSSGGTTVISVAGTDAVSGKSVGLSLTNIPGPGTYNAGYTVSGTQVVGALLTYSYSASASDDVVYSSSTTPGAASGTVTVQELTDTTCKATFSGSVTKLQGTAGPGTVTIANGSVNAKLF